MLTLAKSNHSSPAKKRSPLWRSVEKTHLKLQPRCQSCGHDQKLQVHHIAPYHISPGLELDPDNLITLCESETKCHLFVGHLGNWQNFNPHVIADAARLNANLPFSTPTAESPLS